jgi:hypothetical protein
VVEPESLSLQLTGHPLHKVSSLKVVPAVIGPCRSLLALSTPFLDYEAEFQRTVRTWASTLLPVEGDEYGILPILPNLQSCSHDVQ